MKQHDGAAAAEGVLLDTGQQGRQGAAPGPGEQRDQKLALQVSGEELLRPSSGGGGMLQDLVLTMAAERTGKESPGGVCNSSMLLSLLLAHLLQAGFRPQLQTAAQVDQEAEPAPSGPQDPLEEAATSCSRTPTPQSPPPHQRPRTDTGPRPTRFMRAFRPMPYLRSLQLDHQQGRRRCRVAPHQTPRKFLGRRAPHPAIVSARAAQVARVRAAARVVVDGVADGARAIQGMLSALLPDEWPNTLAKDKKFSVTLSLPPFTDCTFRLVAALWADVMLVNLSVLWESGGADAPTTTYSLALPVGEYVVEDAVRARPQLQNISRLAESVKTVLSRPAMCAARTAHAVVNPSLLGLPLRAARRVLACLPVADLGRLAACCRALHALTTDPVLWRYTLTRDFGPLALTQGALTVGEGVPQAGQDAVDWRAEYKRLYRQRSALQIRRPSSDCRYCLPGLPLRPPPLHDSVHSFHRQQLQQMQLQSTSSLGLIREDNGVSPEDGASSPPPEVQPPLRVQGQQPLSLQSFYSSSAAAAPPRRTRSSKSTTSKASSVASHRRALRRAQPAPATEEVVKVGSKVYKALVGAVTKSSAVTATAPSQAQRKTCVDRRKHGFYDSDDKFHSAEFDNPSIASSRASSSRSRSFCKVSSGSRRGSFSLSGSFMKKSATRKQQPPPPAAQTALPEAAPSSSPTKRAESQPTKTPAEAKDPESRPRSRTRRGLGAAACSPPNLSLSEHRPYAPADDPNYERLLTTASSPIKTQAGADDPSAPPARPRAAPSKAATRPASHRRQSSASALHRSAPRAATKAGRPADCSAET